MRFGRPKIGLKFPPIKLASRPLSEKENLPAQFKSPTENAANALSAHVLLTSNSISTNSRP